MGGDENKEFLHRFFFGLALEKPADHGDVLEAGHSGFIVHPIFLAQPTDDGGLTIE